MDFRSTQFEFRRVRLDRTHGYWGFKDDWFVPYVWLEERDIPRLPLPFATFSLHYDSPVGRVSADPEMLTNIIPLPDAPGALALQSDLRKDLRRVTRLNSDLTFRENVPENLEAACTWFAEQFHECKRDLGRRLSLYLTQARWTAAHLHGKLVAVHIAAEDAGSMYYLGCWWDRSYRQRSIPIFLLHRDILAAIGRGKRFYDLGIGNEPYKKKWPVVEKRTKYYARVDDETRKALDLSPEEVELVGRSELTKRLRRPSRGASREKP